MSDLESQRAALRDRLVDAGLLIRTPVDGVYYRTEPFERVVRGVEDLAHRTGVGSAEPRQSLPPIMPREILAATDYLRSFPQLVGSIQVFTGGDRDHAELLRLADEGQDWTQALRPSDVALPPAACHPLYPQLTGELPEGGRTLEVLGFCFRHEPSVDPTRMQSFRMNEFVRVGTPEEALAHRDAWLERGLDVLSGLGLPVVSDIANDPFFGRAGRILSTSQRDTELKYEILCPVVSPEAPTAIASANYHLDHFGAPFKIRTADGQVAHSACFGFGLERISLALVATHGTDPDGWPSSVRQALWG